MDVRLTAEDGYTAQRSFSLAEPSSNGRLAITVDLVPHGEVSPYLVGTMEVGDQLDVRGPIGGWFVWRPGDPQTTGAPILLIAGGSGVVPLVTMLRARNEALDPTRMLLVYSLRGPEDLMYAHDLEGLQAHNDRTSAGADGVEVRLVYTRHSPSGSPRRAGHLTAADLKLPPTWGAALASRVYLCGSSGFAEHASNLLHAVGYSDQHIRIERFGPSGVES